MMKLLAFAALLAACTTSTPDSGDLHQLQTVQPIIDGLHFTTSTSIAANPAPSVDVTVTGAAARQVYAATLALPTLLPGGYNCPADFGITYDMTFTSGQTEVATGTIEPGGCELATLATTTASASLSAGGTYWSSLAADLGIAEATIYPYVPPGQ